MQNEFPRSVQLGDVTKIGDELGKIDIITGGFPCQTFSIAGARRGFEDTRGTLFFDIARLADIYKPSIWSWRTSKGYSITMGEIPSEVILDKLRGLNYHVQSCYSLTLKTSMFRKTEKGCSLSALLQENVDQKYFVSESVRQKLLKGMN